MNFKTSLKVSSPKEHSDVITNAAFKIATERRFKRILDMGTGTGYIAVFLADRGFNVDGCDVSHHAVNLARENCKGKKINIFQSDLFDNVDGKYDLILFNPPASGKGGESVLGNIIRKTSLRRPVSALFYKLSSKKRLPLIMEFIEKCQFFLNKKGVFLIFLNSREIELARSKFGKIYNLGRVGHRNLANDLVLIFGELR